MERRLQASVFFHYYVTFSRLRHPVYVILQVVDGIYYDYLGKHRCFCEIIV